MLTRSSFGTTRRILNSTWTSLSSWRKFWQNCRGCLLKDTGLSTLWSFVLQWNYFKWNQIIDWETIENFLIPFYVKVKSKNGNQRNTENKLKFNIVKMIEFIIPLFKRLYDQGCSCRSNHLNTCMPCSSADILCLLEMIHIMFTWHYFLTIL